MTKLTQLWQALERIPGLTTTIPYWKRHCGPDYAVIRPFLHATDFSGGTYPCGNADREGCFREIVYSGGNKIVAVCRQEWDPCEEVPLCSDDAVLYELDLRSFTGMIAEALGFRWQHALEDERCPWSIGLLPDGPGSDRTVFLIVETSLSNFLNSVLKVVARSQCRKVILAPTNRLKGTDVQAVLDQHRIPLYPLEEFILEREDGTLGSPNSLAELVSGKVRSKATATLGVSQANGPRGRGFEANASDHRKVAAAVLLFGEHWAAQLPQLCRELHQVGADLPTYWKEKEFVETWEEIASEVEGDGKSSAREKVFKYIKYRIRWVREHPPDFP